MAVSTSQRSGDLLADTYALEERLLSEPTHDVYRARDLQSGEALLVTLLRPELALQQGAVERALARPQLLAALRHPSLARLSVDADDNGSAFVVEELVEGRPLTDLIDAFPQGVPLPLVVELASALLEGLALVHAAGLAHGALDPTQVRLLGPLHAPTPKWIGLHRASAPSRVQDAAYRAPEASGDDDPTDDVFACGVLLYHLLSGSLPFHAGQRAALPLEEVAPQLTAGWSQLTAACMDEQPVLRPADAGAVLARLRKCGATISGRVAAPSQSAPARSPSAATTAGLLRASGPAPRTVSGTARPAPEQTGVASPRARARAQREPSPALPERGAYSVRPSGGPQARPLPSVPAAISARPATERADRRERAQEAADKLGAKHSPRTSARAPARTSSSLPPMAARSRPAPSAGPAARSARPQPGAAGELSPAQLAALAALRARHEERDRDRWLVLLLALLLLLLLSIGLPWFEDPALATARARFGARLPLVATACSVLTLVGALHALVARAGPGVFVQRVQAVALLLVTCCAGAITLHAFGGDTAGLRGASELGARALPWLVGLSLGLFALLQLLRALRSAGHDLVYAVLVAALALGGGAGSYRAVRRGLAQEQARAMARLRAAPAQAQGGEPPPAAAGAEPGAPEAAPQAGEPEPQRNALGANEQDDLAPVEGLERSRKRSGEALEQLRDKVSRSPTSVLVK